MMMSDVFVRYSHVHGAFDDDRPASLNHPSRSNLKPGSMAARCRSSTRAELRAHLGRAQYQRV